MTIKEGRIISPIPTGSGAYVLHKTLEARMHVTGSKVTIPAGPCFLPSSLSWPYPKSCLNPYDSGSWPFFCQTVHSPCNHCPSSMLDQFMRPYSSPAQRLHYQTDLRWYTKASLKMADRVTSISRFTAEMVRRELNYNQPVKIIYCGIDEICFRPGPLENTMACGCFSLETLPVGRGSSGLQLLPGG